MANVVKINTGSVFEQQNAFSRAIRVGDLVFSSNTSGRHHETRVMPADVIAQFNGAVDNVDRALHAAGTSVADSVRVQISFSDLSDQTALLAAFARRFKGVDPALTLICQPFTGEVKVEVEIIANVRGLHDSVAVSTISAR